MDTVKKNAIRGVAIGGCYNVAMMCCTGPVMQTFLNSVGFPNHWIYLSTTLVQIVNMLTILLCSRWADRGDVICHSSRILIPQAVLFIGYIPLCIWPSVSPLSFAFLATISFVQAVTTGLYTVCDYKLPYVILDGSTFTLVIAIGGLISGGLSLVSGLVLTWLAGVFSYQHIMLGGCIAACLLTLVASLLARAQKPLIRQENISDVSQFVPISKLFHHPVFYQLISANILRGFSLGVVSVLPIVALDMGFSEQITTAVVSVQSAATLIICCFFGVVAKRDNLGKLILGGSVVFICLPALITSRTGLHFLLCYFVIIMGKATIDYAIPAVLRWVVPGEIAGIYQAWRMGLTNCGMMLGSMAAVFFSKEVLLISAAVATVTAGIIYYSSIKKSDASLV